MRASRGQLACSAWCTRTARLPTQHRCERAQRTAGTTAPPSSRASSAAASREDALPLPHLQRLAVPAGKTAQAARQQPVVPLSPSALPRRHARREALLRDELVAQHARGAAAGRGAVLRAPRDAGAVTRTGLRRASAGRGGRAAAARERCDAGAGLCIGLRRGERRLESSATQAPASSASAAPAAALARGRSAPAPAPAAATTANQSLNKAWNVCRAAALPDLETPAGRRLLARWAVRRLFKRWAKATVKAAWRCEECEGGQSCDQCSEITCECRGRYGDDGDWYCDV